MKAAILQSNYIPWRGYFDIIDEADVFIIYDDVQYTRHDWRNRNRIKTPTGALWLSVPVQFSLSRPTLICETPIEDKHGWRRKHKGNIVRCYQQAPFFKDYVEDLFDLLDQPYETISELNVAFIKWVMETLDIQTPLMMSSDFSLPDDRNERLITLLQQVGADTYLSGPSARSYLDEARFEQENIQLAYKFYEYPEYPQQFGDFIEGLSILDTLFNCGQGTKAKLKSLKPSLSVF